MIYFNEYEFTNLINYIRMQLYFPSNRYPSSLSSASARHILPILPMLQNHVLHVISKYSPSQFSLSVDSPHYSNDTNLSITNDMQKDPMKYFH